MKLKERYKIKVISYKLAMELVVKHHYLHRKCPCSQAFGLFEYCENNNDLFSKERIVGCVIYGTPSSSPLRKGLCGIEESFNVIELTRLWIEDNTPKNTESFLIGNTIKLVNKEIVVSYAEIQQGHLGIVYQATNWIYTGLSAKRTNWTIEGVDKHCQTIADKYTANEIREKYGDKFKLVDRPRKHRYVYFNASKKRKKELLNKLKYKIEPYPKVLLN
jgi:hypothetical protein